MLGFGKLQSDCCRDWYLWIFFIFRRPRMTSHGTECPTHAFVVRIQIKILECACVQGGDGVKASS